MSKLESNGSKPDDVVTVPRHSWQDLKLDVGAVSLAGGRANNEDNFGIFVPAQQQEMPHHWRDVATTVSPDYLGEKGILLVVADGMGGGMAGRTASTLAVSRLGEHYFEESHRPNIKLDLNDSVLAANNVVCTYASSLPQTRDGLDKPGSTVVAAALHGDKAYIANVGDSRAYLVREDRIEQITQDHVPEAGSNLLTRSLGEDPKVAVDTFEQPFEAGDTLLLCSDGLTDLLSDEEILRVVSSGSAQRAAEKLAKEANGVGVEQYGGDSYDNITAVVVRRQVARRRLPIGPMILGGAAVLTLLVFAALGTLVAQFLSPSRETVTPPPTVSQLTPVADTPTIMASTPTALPTLPTVGNPTAPIRTSPTEVATRPPTSTPRTTSTPTATYTPTRTPTPTSTHTPTSTSTQTPTARPIETAPPQETREPRPRRDLPPPPAPEATHKPPTG